MIFLGLCLSALAAPLPLAVESVVFSAGTDLERTTSGEGLRRIEGALIQSVPSVLTREPSYFDPATPDAPLRLAVRIQDADCRANTETTIRCQTSLEWALYHQPTDTIIYRISLMGQASDEDWEEALISAMLDTVPDLASKAGFQQRLDASFYPAPIDPLGVRDCASSDPIGARLGTANTRIWAIAVDGSGAVLVGGASTETLRLRQGTGPWLEATRLASEGGLSLYHLPVERGLVCAGDEVVSPDGATSVGAALALLGRARHEPPKAPQSMNDTWGSGSRPSSSFGFDEIEDE